MVQIYEQVVSDIYFLHLLQNSDNFTYIYSRRVLLFWQTEDVQN